MPKSIFVVGALYNDILLHTDYYPKEDTKTRVNKVTSRRGGNSGNTLEVLKHLSKYAPPFDLECVCSLSSDPLLTIYKNLLDLKIPTAYCKWRKDVTKDPTSYIITTKDSRTIFNDNPLPDITAAEFIDSLEFIDKNIESWFHFEGRNAQEIGLMIGWIRSHFNKSVISVECEKADKGLDVLYELADVLFFSNEYFEASGLDDGFIFLKTIQDKAPKAELILTRGSKGAYYMSKQESGSVAAPVVNVVDTIGAGDTFIAAFIFNRFVQNESFVKSVEFAVNVASKKCACDGFNIDLE